MPVTIHLPGILRPHAANQPQLHLAPTPTLATALDTLAQTHPALERRLRDEQGTLRRHVNFFIDGEECRQLQGKHTPLPPNAQIHIIPSVAGG
ncbi:MoaD/ThiS family protein [Actinokineospora sp. NPDC004072]